MWRRLSELVVKREKKRETARVRTQEPSKSQWKDGEFRRSGMKRGGRRRKEKGEVERGEVQKK